MSHIYLVRADFTDTEDGETNLEFTIAFNSEMTNEDLWDDDLLESINEVVPEDWSISDYPTIINEVDSPDEYIHLDYFE